ncbi:hypothetical protein FOZ63_019719, partial [Perkinsus olseni]
VKEIRATWRKAGFKSDRPKKPHRRHGSKGSNSTTTSNSTLGTTQKRERANKVKGNPGHSVEREDGPSAAALTLPSPPASALWWCDACGWNSEAPSSSSTLQCAACKVKVHKTCAGCNWGKGVDLERGAPGYKRLK